MTVTLESVSSISFQTAIGQALSSVSTVALVDWKCLKIVEVSGARCSVQRRRYLSASTQDYLRGVYPLRI